MTIEAPYLSRRQSRRRNPLFRKERRARHIAMAGAALLALSGGILLRCDSGKAALESAPASRSALPALHFDSTSPPRNPVRFVPLYRAPEDTVVATSPLG